MRRALLFCAAIAFAIACGDNVTEPMPDRTVATPPIAFATTTTEDGLSISTDKDDYQPGDTVHFTGQGWQSGDVLDIVLTDDPLTHEPHAWTVDVGADGMFHDTTYVVDEGDINVKFTLVATSRATGRSLTVQFTDAELVTAELAVPINDVTVTQGTTANFDISLSATGAIKCVATAASPATAKVHTVFSISGTGVLSSSTLSGAFNFFGGAAAGGPNNCDVAWTGAPTPYTAAASVSAAATTPVGNYTITLRSSALNVVLTNPSGPGGSLADDVATTITVRVVAPANVAPNAPTALGQFKLDGTTGITTGLATNEASVVLKGTVSDPDLTNTVKLQVEVRPIGTAFSNTSMAESGLVSNGTVASATVGSLVNGTRYHWQARAVDNSGVPSAWVSFGGNAEGDTDFRVLTDRPTVTINKKIGQADPTNTSPINFTVVFSEDVTGFTGSDVSFTGSTVGGTLNAAVTDGPSTYNVAVTGMTGTGTVLASIPEGVASDAAGNANTASASADVTFDGIPPDVTINQAGTQVDPTKVSPINFTVVFSEPVSGFAAADVTLGGATGAAAAVTGGPTTYNVAVSGMTDGTVTASIAAGKAQDGVGNLNTVSTSTDNTVTYDVTPPVVSCDAADVAWHTPNASIACTASDITSGLADAADANFTLSTDVADGIETTNASTNSRTIFDAAGNSATAGPVSGNMVDRKDPQVSCGAADALWHAADVSIACTASDDGSGILPASDVSFSLSTTVAAGTETSNASTGTKPVADAVGNSVTAGPISGNKIDKKGPVVSLTCPETPVILGSSASANWTAIDLGSGVTGANTGGSINLATTPVGPHQATAGVGTSKDDVANDSPAAYCNYSVIYNWTGFFQPVDNSNLNIAKAGSAIPVKFNLGGNQGLAIFISGSPSSSKVDCANIETDPDTIEETVNAGGSSLTYDASASQYIYVWKTEKTSWVGQCRRLDVKLIDGTTHSAYFKFKN